MTEMDTPEKRRRGNICDGNGEPTRRTRPRSEERAILEEEVKEFFAIIHRMRKATGDGDRGADRRDERTSMEGTERLGKWRPTFKLEDFEAAAVMADEISTGGALPVKREVLRIDLNVEPERDGQTSS